jgi:hypothetical protein
VIEPIVLSLSLATARSGGLVRQSWYEGLQARRHNPVHHEANKHVAIADHFAREQVELGIITISHMRTDDLPADVLTKPLPKAKFLKLVQTFMN